MKEDQEQLEEQGTEEDEELLVEGEFIQSPKPRKKKKKRGRPKSRGRHRPKRRTERFRPPIMRQRKQKGDKRREDALYYMRNRIDRLWYQNEYNRLNAENPKHQRAIMWRRENAGRIRRRASAEKVALEYMANFFVVDRTPAKDLPQQYRDMTRKGLPRGNLDPESPPQGTTTWRDGEIRDEQHPGHPLDVDSNGGPGSSAKVIPYSGDLANYTSWMEKNASMNMDQILAGLDEEIIDRGHEYWPILYRMGPRFLYFEVGDYKVRVHFPNVPFEKFRQGTFPEGLRDEETAFDCSCKFWRWQGPEHWAKVHGYDLAEPRGTASVPRVRDPLGNKLVCKHVAAVINYLARK